MADPVLSKEPVFVFGARVSGPHRESSAAVAQRFHAAEPTVAEGRTGNAYAIPHRGADGKMLTPSMLSNHVQAFRRYAAGNGSTAFHVTKWSLLHTLDILTAAFHANTAGAALVLLPAMCTSCTVKHKER